MIDFVKFREELRNRLGSSYKTAREEMGMSSDSIEDDGLEIVEQMPGSDIDREMEDLKKREVELKRKEIERREKELQEQDDEGLGDLGQQPEQQQQQPDYEDDRQRTTSNQLETALKGWRQDMFAAAIMNMEPQELADFIEGLKVDAMQILVDNAKIEGQEGPSQVGGDAGGGESADGSGLKLADL